MGEIKGERVGGGWGDVLGHRGMISEGLSSWVDGGRGGKGGGRESWIGAG